MRLPAVLIEAFAAAPCQGNGAAVVRLESPIGATAMQAIAGSLRQSETAFVLPWQNRWLLRWFTPLCEVRLCGHATLAALLALEHWGDLSPGASLDLHTRSGPLEVSLDPVQHGRGSIVLPASPMRSATPAPALAERLGQLSGLALGGYWASSLGYHVALLPPGAALESLNGLADRLEGPERNGLVVMAAVDPKNPEAPTFEGVRADYALRFFAPGLGIPEDPVTGSAHAMVAPFWLAQTGKEVVVGWQPSTRPGGMACRAASSGMIHLLGTGHLLWDGLLHFGTWLHGVGGSSASGERDGWGALLPSG